jgi:hypothetical protein
MTLKLEGVDGVLKEIARFRTGIKTEVDDLLQEAANEVVTRAKLAAPSNFAELKNSIQQKREKSLKYLIFANAYHAPYIEFGTRGKVSIPSEMQEVAAEVKGRPKRGNWETFVADIKVWMKKRGVGGTVIAQVKSGKRKGQFKRASKKAQSDYIDNVAFLIARSIYKNGISPQPFLYPSFLSVKGKLINDIRVAVEKSPWWQNKSK